MKEIVSFLSKHSIIYKKFNELDLKDMGIKRKLRLFNGVDLKQYYNIVIVIDRKSRFLQKDVDVLEDIAKVNIDYSGHNFKKKIVIISNDICSKAKLKLKDNGWRVFNGSL
jgi:hypothetical protein